MTNKEKRLSRCTALQVLYGNEVAHNAVSELLDFICNEFEDETYSDNVKRYSANLVGQAQNNSTFLNNLICEKSKNWDIKRIALIDNIILRLAIGEMLFVDEIPLKVSIAEAIEIAKLFSTKDSGRFVNGILDAIYHDIKNGKLTVH